MNELFCEITCSDLTSALLAKKCGECQSWNLPQHLWLEDRNKLPDDFIPSKTYKIMCYVCQKITYIHFIFTNERIQHKNVPKDSVLKGQKCYRCDDVPFYVYSITYDPESSKRKYEINGYCKKCLKTTSTNFRDDTKIVINFKEWEEKIE